MNQNACAGLQLLSAFISNGPKWTTRLSALKCASQCQSVEHVGCGVGGGPSMNSDKLFPLPSHPFINSVSFVRHRMNWAAIDFALCVQNNVSFTKEYSHASHSKVLVLFPWINHPHLWNPFHFTTQAHLSQWKEKSLNYFKLKSYLAWRGIKDHLPILWINYAENKSSILVLPSEEFHHKGLQTRTSIQFTDWFLLEGPWTHNKPSSAKTSIKGSVWILVVLPSWPLSART